MIGKCAVMLVFLGLFVPTALAQTTGQPSATAQKWFELGYRYNDAESPTSIRTLRGLIPGTMPAAPANPLTQEDESGRRPYRHPVYWAALGLVGDWR